LAYISAAEKIDVSSTAFT